MDQATSPEQQRTDAPCIDFQEVCQHLYDGIHITDGDGRVLFINEAYTRTTGIRPEDVVGRRVGEIEAEGKLYKGSVTEEVLTSRARVNSVAHILPLDKEVLVTGTPVFDDGGKIKLVVTNTRDFPELKRLERRLLALTEEQRRTNEELAFLRRQQSGGRELICRSEAMKSVLELIRTVAKTDVTVLITGETGTGKELIANEIYQKSDRRDKPFIKVNCAAIPAELLESELFGYEEGAFTGARKSGKAGMFELADTGVILLDEIGDMPLPLQSKLLRVLQEREFMRIGGSRPIKLNIRLVAATNKDLMEEIRKGRFREDLYYRLNVVPISLKPLRERKADILYLAEHFRANYCKKYGKDMKISPEGMELLTQYQWPGNIRELENLIERIVVTNESETTITWNHVAAALNHDSLYMHGKSGAAKSLKEQVSAFERDIVLRTIRQEGSVRQAAKVLQVDHSTLVKKCRQYEKTGGEIFPKSGE